MELQIMEAMDIRAEQKLQRQAEVDAKMQEYFNTINELDVLEQDKGRISAEEKRLRMDVLNKVKQYNGNLEHFMYGGGAGTMQSYHNNLMESEAVKNAMANKFNYGQWMHAQANGLFVKDVGVEMPVLDPETGEMRMERRKVSMDEAHGLFEKGVIDKLPYDGAEKDIKVGPEMFQQIYKDPRNPYAMDTEVSAQDVYTWVLEHGGSHDQAMYKSQKYQTMLDQGATQWRYKSGDFLKRDLMKAQIYGQHLKNKGLKMQNEQFQKPPNLILDPMSRVRNMGVGQQEQILPDEWEFISGNTGLGLQFDKESGNYKATRPTKGYDLYVKGQNDSPKEYDLRNFDEMWPVAYVKDPKTGAPMLKMGVRYNTDGKDSDAIPVYESWSFEQYNEGTHVNNWNRPSGDEWGSDTWEGTVYVPVQDQLGWWSQTYMNKETNVRSNAWMYPESGAHTSTEIMYNDMETKMGAAADYVSQKIGVSWNEAYEMVSGYTMGQVQPEVGSGGTQYQWNQQQK